LTFTVDDEVALFVHKKGFASEVVRVRDAQIGACVGVLQLVHSSSVEVVERAVVEDAIIAETATGLPTISRSEHDRVRDRIADVVVLVFKYG